jgi:4-amino-4-deoxy-L-arabinose transferase-like glycosyltransferase
MNGWISKIKLHLQLSKLQFILLIFAVVYTAFLILNLSYIPMQWDEVNHFNGALLLLKGNVWQYAALNSYYPPLFNLVTVAYFSMAGTSLLTGRLVAVTFSLFCMFVVYKITKKMFGEKTALVSALMFAVMPGIIWLSSIALIETMLIFAFSVCMLFFFRWLQTDREHDLTLSLVALAVGGLVKYQILVVAPIIMIISVLVFKKSHLIKTQINKRINPKFLLLGISLGVVAAVLLFALYASGLLNVWLYVMQIGNAGQTWYSNRFPMPIFYLIEMVLPYNDKHPISMLLYGLGLAGLAFFGYRRKPQDKFLLIWFFTVIAVFTLIPNRQWRYVTPLFPVLAISATALVASVLVKAQKIWQAPKSNSAKKHSAKVAAAFLIVFSATGFYFSVSDAYTWAAQGQPQIPIQQATEYAASITKNNESILVLCPYNLFNKDMVWFHLNAKNPSQTQVYQYPELAVDAYKPEFNSTELITYCQANGTKAVMLYEYGGNTAYYDSNLTEIGVFAMLNDTGRFSLQNSFGQAPNRILVLSFS